ncbi:DUF6297 family protein [Kitasatospora sp. NPDC058243]|uniref:DUF6297 family protein n=1 Tax=Kitasatospora sp. NPDC058243 TaxID=3346397 RepID=UPI0036DC26B1
MSDSVAPATGTRARVPDRSGDCTADTLLFLREARSGTRQEKRRSAWFIAYTVLLVGGCWGVPALLQWTSSTRAADRPPVQIGEQASATLLALIPAVLVLALLLTARGAMWRGPVLLDRATTGFLLPSAVDRRALLAPGLRSSVALASVVSGVAGAVAGFLLQGLAPQSWILLTLAGSWTGVSVALTTSAVGVLVERHDQWMSRYGRRVFAAGWLLAAVAAVGVWTAWTQGRTGWLQGLLLWSGPWGWASQPLLWALGLVGAAGAVGTVLSVGTPVLALALAWRELPAIPQAALRLRATVAAQISTSVLMLDLRQARSGVPRLKERRSTPRLRLPMPRHRLLLVPWRDLTCLLRNPRRLGWAVVWSGIAVGLTAAAPSFTSTAQQIVVVLSLVAEYLAAAQLTEPARLESDDPRRSTNLPWTFKSLALQHSAVPGGLLLALTGAGALACALAGRETAGLLPLLASVPALTAAALVSSYRGVVPVHLTIGVNTPMGNTGPGQVALWYLRGPLAVGTLLFPLARSAAQGHPYAATQLAWTLAVTAAALWWVRRTAHRLHTR